jgi:hypothetical protein
MTSNPDAELRWLAGSLGWERSLTRLRDAAATANAETAPEAPAAADEPAVTLEPAVLLERVIGMDRAAAAAESGERVPAGIRRSA